MDVNLCFKRLEGKKCCTYEGITRIFWEIFDTLLRHLHFNWLHGIFWLNKNLSWKLSASGLREEPRYQTHSQDRLSSVWRISPGNEVTSFSVTLANKQKSRM